MLTSTPRTITYSTNGSTLAFDFSFKMWRETIETDIVVVFQEGESDEATLLEATDFTLIAANNDYSSGGTVTLNTGSIYAVNGKTITIRSELPRTQTYNLETGGDLDLDNLETVLDRQTAMIKEAEEQQSISQTLTVAAVNAQLALVMIHDGSVVTYNNDIVLGD